MKAPVENLPAERSVLSSMARHPQAIAEVLEIVGPEDFSQPLHREMFRAIIAMFASQEVITFVTLVAYLKRNAVRFAEVDVRSVVEEVIPPAAVQSHARLVWESAVRRNVVKMAMDAAQMATELDTSPQDILARAGRLIDQISRRALAERAGALSLREFMELDDSRMSPVIPGMLDHQDRALVVGEEGSGKTVMAHQVAFGVAAGVHPFVFEPMPPGRVLIVDLENPLKILQRRLRELTDVASTYPQWDENRITMYARPGGIDLFRPDDAFELANVIRLAQPDIIVGGPIYKMFEESDHDSPRHAAIARFFDKMRERYGSAIWLETHAPIQSIGGKRSMRPIGWSGWTRWPEFGISLMRKEGEKSLTLQRFRGDRDEDRVWPVRLDRNPAWRPRWPWMAAMPNNTFPGRKPQGELG